MRELSAVIEVRLSEHAGGRSVWDVRWRNPRHGYLEWVQGGGELYSCLIMTALRLADRLTETELREESKA